MSEYVSDTSFQPTTRMLQEEMELDPAGYCIESRRRPVYRASMAQLMHAR
jgi:hypothetical protein